VHWDSSGAAVRLRTNIGLKQDLTIVTNERGEFVIELPPGFYDVFVSARGFTPYASKIRLRQGEATNYTPKLRVDRLVAQELGEPVPR
jgi:hypothetical protein